MKQKKLMLVALAVVAFCGSMLSQEVDVAVNFNIKHSVDGVSDFGRERHITVHSSLTERDWTGHEDMMDYFFNDLDVYFGRDNGSAGWKNTNVTQDPNKPGWPDVSYLESYGQELREWYEGEVFEGRDQYEKRSKGMIMGINPHPNYPTLDWNTKGPGRLRPGKDDEWQIFDVKASAFMMAHYLDNHFSKNENEIGEPIPGYWECINEPDMEMFGWHKMFVTSPELLWEYHNETAKIFKEVLGDKAPKVGGMTWGQHDLPQSDLLLRQDPQFYIDNGDDIIDAACTSVTWDHRKDKWWQWDGLFQGFIDNSGPNMDFYSVHIYDWPQVDETKNIVRAGGHVEAMLDLLEWYDMHKFGEKKDIVISEFGSVGPGVSQLPLKQRDWGNLRPFNQMFMQFLERPSHVVLSMPFAPAKAQWGDEFAADGSIDKRYSVTLMDPVGEYTETADKSRYEHTEWEWSKIILWYELWSDVDGTRVDTKSSDRDIQVDCYVDGNHAYLILNNLELDPTTINLHYFDDYENAVKSVHVKHQRYDEASDLPVNDEATFATAPGTVVLDNSATMILDYEFENPVTIDQESKEYRFMGDSVTSETTFLGAQKCYTPVGGRSKFTTKINNIDIPTIGEATLRIGLNTFRTGNIEIVVNGHTLSAEYDDADQTVVDDWRGRELIRSGSGWYGVFEQDVPLEYLNEDINTIEVTNHRHDSEYSTFILQTWDFTKAPGRCGEDSVSVTSIANNWPATIMAGTEVPLSVDFTPLNATNKGIVWNSSDPSVATVNEFGVLTGVASTGSTIITATSKSNGTAITTKTISAAPFTPTVVTGITISDGGSITVPLQTNTPLTAIVAPVDATVNTVTWSSSNPEAVYVNPATGKVTGKVLGGSATITAKIIDTENSDTEFTANINVDVTISGNEMAYVGELTESVTGDTVFNIDMLCKLAGARNVTLELIKGASTLIATETASVDTLGNMVIPFSLKASSIPAIGDDYKFKATITDGASTIFTGESPLSILDIVHVDSVVIKDWLTDVSIDSTLPVSVMVYPADAFDKTYSFSSSSPAVASVDENGVVKGLTAGKTTITVTSNEGNKTDEVEITVVAGDVTVLPTAIIVEGEINVFPETPYTVSYTIEPEWATETDVLFEIDNTSIANVDANGVITPGDTEGIVTLTITSASAPSIKGTSTVTVKGKIIVQAEEFTTTGGAFDGFQTYTIDGEGAINWNQLGDWADYSVAVPETGYYSVNFLIGCPATNTKAGVKLYVDSQEQFDVAVPAGAGYDAFVSFSPNEMIYLTAGNHTIRVESSNTDSWQWNLERFELLYAGETSDVNETTESVNTFIYPNPATDIITIANVISENAELSIYNTPGVLVLKRKISADNNNVNIQSLPNGLYFAVIKDKNVNKIVSFIKE